MENTIPVFAFLENVELRQDLSRDFTAVVSLPMTVEIVHKINTCLVR